MKYFGEPVDSAFWLDAEQTLTPIGVLCVWCEQAINDGDQGVVTSVMGERELEEVTGHSSCYLGWMVDSAVKIENEVWAAAQVHDIPRCLAYPYSPCCGKVDAEGRLMGICPPLHED